jgi:hypothetical protein
LRRAQVGSQDKSKDTLLWDQLSAHRDLYKFFFDWVLKLVIFYYGSTGAIVSFYLSQPQPTPVRYALALPFVVSILLLLLFLLGWRGLVAVQAEIRGIEKSLESKGQLDVGYLSIFLVVNALMFFLVALGLVWLFLFEAPQSFRA